MNSKTVTVQIGNSDDKLTQSQWHHFVTSITARINADAHEIHFHACSNGSDPWQNSAWIFDISPVNIENLKDFLSRKCRNFNQDSITWTQGETEFITSDSPQVSTKGKE